MAEDPGTGSELTASTPRVTILTDGLPGPAGLAARGHDEARVIPVADAMSEGLPSRPIVAVSDTDTVVAVLDLFRSTAVPGAVIRLVMVDSLEISNPDLIAALALFDVTSIDTRAASPIFTLCATGSANGAPSTLAQSQHGSAVRWTRQLSQAQNTAEPDRPLTYATATPAGEQTPSVHRRSGSRRSYRAAKALVTHPIVPMTVATFIFVLIGFLSILSFSDRPAAILLSMVFGTLLLGIGGLVLAFLVRSRRFETATAKAQRLNEQSKRRMKALEDQVCGLRSAISAATSTMGAATAAANELMLRSSAGFPHQRSADDLITDQLREELRDLTTAVALIEHELNGVQERIGH